MILLGLDDSFPTLKWSLFKVDMNVNQLEGLKVPIPGQTGEPDYIPGQTAANDDVFFGFFSRCTSTVMYIYIYTYIYVRHFRLPYINPAVVEKKDLGFKKVQKNMNAPCSHTFVLFFFGPNISLRFSVLGGFGGVQIPNPQEVFLDV